jgi:hypothetical protein
MVGVVSVDLVPPTVVTTGLKSTDFSGFLSPTAVPVLVTKRQLSCHGSLRTLWAPQE